MNIMEVIELKRKVLRAWRAGGRKEDGSDVTKVDECLTACCQRYDEIYVFEVWNTETANLVLTWERPTWLETLV